MNDSPMFSDTDGYRACVEDNDRYVQAWLNHDSTVGQRVFSDGKTWLMIAAGFGAVRCVDSLLPHSDAKAQDSKGWTALTHAIVCPRGPACIDQLIPLSDLNTVSAHGASLLHIAAWLAPLDAVPQLLSTLNLDLDLIRRPDHEGQTLLHWAVDAGLLERTKMLLPYSDPNHVDKNGWTALMIAVKKKHQKLVMCLAKVTNVAWVGAAGQSAINLAECQSGSNMLEFLKEEVRRQERELLRTTADETMGPFVVARQRPRL